MISWVYIVLFISPLLGGILSLYTGYRNERVLKIFLAFAGAYIFSITVLDLFPIVFAHHDHYAPMMVLLGFFFQIFISRFSEGAEHGHLHIHHHDHSMALPVGLYLSMCLHAFTEGLPLGIIGEANKVMSIGIAMHELPASFALLSILQTEHIRRRSVIILMLLYASMSPLGALTSNLLSLNLPESVFNLLLAFVSGIFVYISTTILLENSENHHFSRQKTVAVAGGILLALLAGFIGH
jgi:zinc transporter ZupT